MYHADFGSSNTPLTRELHTRIKRLIETAVADAAAAAGELGRFSPSEVIRGGNGCDAEELQQALFLRLKCCVDEGKAGQFDLQHAEELLQRHFGKTLAELGISVHSITS